MCIWESWPLLLFSMNVKDSINMNVLLKIFGSQYYHHANNEVGGQTIVKRMTDCDSQAQMSGIDC